MMFKMRSWFRSSASVLPGEKTTAVIPVTETDANRDRKDSSDSNNITAHTEESTQRTSSNSSHEGEKPINPLLYPKRASLEGFLHHLRYHKAHSTAVKEWLRPLSNDELTKVANAIINHPTGCNGFHNEKRHSLHLYDDERIEKRLDKALKRLISTSTRTWLRYDSEKNPLNIQTKAEKNRFLLNFCLRQEPSSFIYIMCFEEQKHLIALLETLPFRADFFPEKLENLATPPNESNTDYVDNNYSFDFFQPLDPINEQKIDLSYRAQAN